MGTQPDLVGRPDLTTIVPYLVLPGLVALLCLLLAKLRGASWAQVQLSFAVAMLTAFMTASSWVIAAYLAGERVGPWVIVGSQILVAVTCGLIVFFGAMPVEQDLTDEYERKQEKFKE
jgi:hypothetical protein